MGVVPLGLGLRGARGTGWGVLLPVLQIVVANYR